MATLKRVDVGLPVPEICRELGIGSATFQKWRAEFGGMDTSMMARMKEIEDESSRLKEIYLEQKPKAEFANEYHARKQHGHLAYARWSQRWCSSVAQPSALFAQYSPTVSPARPTSPSLTPRTSRLPTC